VLVLLNHSEESRFWLFSGANTEFETRPRESPHCKADAEAIGVVTNNNVAELPAVMGAESASAPTAAPDKTMPRQFKPAPSNSGPKRRPGDSGAGDAVPPGNAEAAAVFLLTSSRTTKVCSPVVWFEFLKD